MSKLTARVQSWLEGGEIADIDGRRIFVHTQEGDGPPVLFLHGYPSSSYDWRGVIELLPGRRIVCFDFLGFGLSDKPRDHVYSLIGQADLVESIAPRYCDGPVGLVAHDMGTSVANELMARDIDGNSKLAIDSALLFNGSMILERASLTISQKALRSRFGPIVARFGNERVFRAQFQRIFSDAHPLTDDESHDQWVLLEHGGGNRIIHKLTHYLEERVRFAARWHGAIRDWPGRLELAWAERDPVATTNVLDGILDLRPSVPLTRWPELGHYPQLEDPGAVAEVAGRVGTAAGAGR